MTQPERREEEIARVLYDCRPYADERFSWDEIQNLKDEIIVEAIKEYRHMARAVLQHLPALENKGWLPIETAPKDGTEILTFGCLHDDGGVDMGETPFRTISRWKDGCWYSPECGSHQPTDWQPLPSPPPANLKVMRG